MSGGKVTSAQVAERAGVSRSAVSRVFTPGASVSDATAAKVRKAATDLGYRPNALARSLLTGQSRMIGLVVSYLDNHFYPGVLETLSRRLQADGYHILMFMAGSDAGEVDEVVGEILDYQVDGLVLASAALSSDLAARCRATDVPVVLFNRRQGAEGEISVVSDNHSGGRLAAEHLIARGAWRIGHIAGWEGASTQREREAGFLGALRAAGLGLHAREIGNFDKTQAAEAVRRMFGDAAARPDGLFVANDYMALIAMDVLRYELGLSVPGDVRVVGFDDVPAAAWPGYGLTTLRQDVDAMVEQTVAALSGTAVVAPLPVRLVVRGSS
ncbi:MAG: LacI family DNA-binding transcriptional regulator [Pseudomonadota bacterium]